MAHGFPFGERCSFSCPSPSPTQSQLKPPERQSSQLPLPPLRLLSSVPESQAPYSGPKVGSHPKDLGKKARSGGWDPQFWRMGLYRTWAAAHAWVTPPTNPIPIRDQRGERGMGGENPKDLSVKRHGQSRALAINSWAVGENQGSGSAVLGPERKGLVDPSPLQ